ncbi:hypothetical protein KIH27_17990 [Mycobacterium sp. M1]|uniref:Uncharacterized protein n=1 Tax=Mycolicibacter acidiphilus TaxID=2835306 RepID=A0ABS5RME9_9MYCO|nr:hypothetical protein [Mycolicibacter acidiphilus]MBS9535480.1 hypothetical protein [Mycolicibacter acidiphilus]
MPSDDLEARVSALEAQVHDLTGQVSSTRRDAAAARVLAGAADRDVTEVRDDLRDFRRATVASFNALRQDMIDMRQDMTDGFTEMRAKFDLTAAGQQRIVELIQSVIDGRGGAAPA